MNQQLAQQPALRLVSVNIEADKHLERVLSFVTKEQPDILCLQEVFAADLPLFEGSLGMHSYYAPMTLRPRYTRNTEQPVSWGAALLSKQPLSNVAIEYYATYGRSAGDVPVFNHQQSTVQKVLVSGTVRQGDTSFHIGTTHFTWSPEGQPNDEQRQDLQGLLTTLTNHPNIVFCGDFNAPRGGEICNAIEQYYINNIPADITTTLDQNLHRVKGLQHVVDHIFSTPEYTVSDVQVIDGISDHCALTATIRPTTLLPITIQPQASKHLTGV